MEDCWPRSEVEEDVVDLPRWFGIWLESGGQNRGGGSRFNVCCIPFKVFLRGRCRPLCFLPSFLMCGIVCACVTYPDLVFTFEPTPLCLVYPALGSGRRLGEQIGERGNMESVLRPGFILQALGWTRVLTANPCLVFQHLCGQRMQKLLREEGVKE